MNKKYRNIFACICLAKGVALLGGVALLEEVCYCEVGIESLLAT